MISLGDWVQLATSIFTAIAAGAAVATIIANNKLTLKTVEANSRLTRETIERTAAIAREQTAADTVKKYIELSIQHPKLSTGGSPEDRYAWYISFMLIAVRDILRAHPNDPQWRELMREQIDYNKDELALWEKETPEYFERYGSEVHKLVKQVLSAKSTRVSKNA